MDSKKRFDYKILRVSCDTDVNRILQDLEVLGNSGWELVGPPSMVPLSFGGIMFWYHFKKPLEE